MSMEWGSFWFYFVFILIKSGVSPTDVGLTPDLTRSIREVMQKETALSCPEKTLQWRG